LVERKSFSLPHPNHSCIFRGASVLHSVREERREESERSLQNSKEWKEVMAVFTHCKLLICINIIMLLG
jgi:hypothetical protein